MTGRFPSRSSTSRRRSLNQGVDLSYVTIPTTKLVDVDPSRGVEDGHDCTIGNAAAVFSANGYKTGVVGKWHLFNDGNDDYNYQAVQQEVRDCGFDFAEAIYKENLDGDWAIDVTHNMEHVTAKAIEFIEDSVADNKPFFLYLNPTVPHGSGDVTDALSSADCRNTVEGFLGAEPDIPFGMTADYADCRAYRQSVLDRGGDNDKQAGAVWVDDSIGSVLMTLEALGQLDNTFFLFQQDHGQEGKGSLYETGSRIAQFVHFPNWIAAGSTFDGLVSTIDILPTMVSLQSSTFCYFLLLLTKFYFSLA
jgi:arylsulfatase A-like enzyme